MHEVGIPTNKAYQPAATFSVLQFQLVEVSDFQFRYLLYLAALRFTGVIIPLSSIESRS